VLLLAFDELLHIGELEMYAPLAELEALAWADALLEIYKVGFVGRAG